MLFRSASGDGFDVVVSGRLVHSTIGSLALELEARDALGRRLDPRIHRAQGDLALREVVDGVAVDLLRWRAEGPKGNQTALRAAALLRFGAELAPEVFGRYLPPPRRADSAASDSVPVPAPALGPQDPLLLRLQRVWDRDQAFLTILNRHYTELHDALAGPYGDWRAGASVPQAIDSLEATFGSFASPGPASVVQAEGYEKTLAGSVEGQFLAWRRLARRALRLEAAVVR